jgi:hypothetical protein
MVASDIRRVDVTTHDVEEEVYFDDVAAWETRPRERTGQWSFEDDDKPSEPYCLLRLVREDGGSLLVHTFDPADAAVAQRLSAHLSVATDAICRLPTSGSGSADWDDDDR